jgi:hypothetical protein
METIFMSNLLRFAGLIVLGHLAVVIWHLVLLVRIQPNTPDFALVLLGLINLVPVAGLAVFARGKPRLAGCMVLVPLGVALFIGSYTHFLRSGSDNVLQMPSGGLTLPFQITAGLLVLLEAVGSWLGLRMLVSQG